MNEAIIKAKTTTTPKLYLDFFKSYYKEKTKTLTFVTTVIGICMIVTGAWSYIQQISIITCAVLIAGGAMLIIYPRFVYRRPYNSAKNNKITTHFEFYDDKMVEINDATREEYRYSSLLKVYETEDYFYIYHTPENASVVDKEGISKGSPEELKSLLSGKVEYSVKGHKNHGKK